MRGQNLKALALYTDRHNLAYNSNGGICNEAGNSVNAIEQEPVETRVLNPTMSEASFKTETMYLTSYRMLCTKISQLLMYDGLRFSMLCLLHVSFNSR